MEVRVPTTHDRQATVGRNVNSKLKMLAEKINGASSVILSTHKQCDGDGLGAQLGLFHALKSIGKKVRVINVDATPKKYRFLNPDQHIQYFEEKFTPIEQTDLALILDTNDRRLVEPLYSSLENTCDEIIFIDHHPHLKQGPAPTKGSYIDPNAASTGEIAFNIIREMGIGLNADIARAIYTSIAFDTQLFRYVRNSPTSHLIAAELLLHETDPAEVHRYLFANHTVDKIRFLSKALEKIEYFLGDRIAILRLDHSDLTEFSMDTDDSRDLIDMIMNIDTLAAGAMIRRDSNGEYKVSIRSKGDFEVRAIAEALGGGGHMFASGATVDGEYEEIKATIVDGLKALVNKTQMAS